MYVFCFCITFLLSGLVVGLGFCFVFLRLIDDLKGTKYVFKWGKKKDKKS